VLLLFLDKILGVLKILNLVVVVLSNCFSEMLSYFTLFPFFPLFPLFVSFRLQELLKLNFFRLFLLIIVIGIYYLFLKNSFK